MLLILGGNPAYDAPADLGFADALKNSKFRRACISVSINDETAELCHWHVNEAHYLESWGDARAYDGTVSIVQPLIAPLYGGKSAYELIALFLRGSRRRAATNWFRITGKQHTGADFDAFWRKSLHDGWIEGTAFAPKQVTGRASSFPSPVGRRRTVD